MAIWRTTDEAVAAAAAMLVGSGLQGIDYSRVRVQGSREGSLARREACAAVMAAVGQYDHRTRRMLVGHAVGMSHRQVARALGISERTVRRHHHAAYAQLDRRLVSLGLVEAGIEPLF